MPPTPNTSLLAPLALPTYRLAWFARLLALAADFSQVVVLSVLALDLTQRPSGWGLVLTIQAVPRALLMLVGGVATDRFRAQQVILWSNLGLGLLLAALGLLASQLGLGMEHLYGYAVVSGLILAFFLPASSTLVTELVPAEQFHAANALWQLAFNAARFVAPPIAGTAVAMAGSGPALALAAACSLTAALLVGLIRAPSAARPLGAPPLRQLSEGLAAARQDRVVYLTIVLATIGSFGFSGASFVGLPALAKLELQAGDQGVGFLYGALGAGAFVGTVLVGLNAGRKGLAVLGNALILLCGVFLAAAGLAPSLLVAALCFAVAGGCLSAAPVIFFTLLQVRTPPELRGRVTSVMTLGLFGLTPLAFGLTGLLGDLLGPRAILLFGGAMMALSGLAGVRSRAMREVN